MVESLPSTSSRTPSPGGRLSTGLGEQRLAAGAKSGIKANDGWTAEAAARDAGHDDIAKLLNESI